MAHALLAHVVRSGFVESEHLGTAVALDATGAPIVERGDTTCPMFPRSANKPLQTVAMLRSGLELDGHLLALASASHSGEHYHRDGVRRILALADLTEQALQTPADLPAGDVEAQVWRRTARTPTPIAHNCSGKHAAMLVTCVINGWPTDTYRDPDHPLQRFITDTVAELTGEPVTAVGVDGCGAPVLAVSAVGLARGYARICTAAQGSPEHRVVQAIRTHPEWLAGTGREATRLMRAVPGLIAKDGAEAVFAAGLPDGRAAVVKIADGAERASGPVLAALLRRLGVDEHALQWLGEAPVLGGGRPVGRLEVVDL